MLGQIAPVAIEAAPLVIQASGTEGSLALPEGMSLALGSFDRVGGDLVIDFPDGSHVIVTAYFDGPQIPSLVGADGSVLGPDLVSSLAGSLAPGQFAQVGAALSEPIGSVETLSGVATATRTDGTVVELEIGDPLYQVDLVQTADGSTVGLLFADNSEFAVGEGARLVLNELIYDPGSQEGSAVFSLLKGIVVFLSGEVAKTDPEAMVIETPVAVMGIRGTKGVIEVQVDPVSGDISVWASVLREFGGFVGEIVATAQGIAVVLNADKAFTFIKDAFSAPTEPAPLGADQQELAAQLSQVLPSADLDGDGLPDGPGEEGAELEDFLTAAGTEDVVGGTQGDIIGTAPGSPPSFIPVATVDVGGGGGFGGGVPVGGGGGNLNPDEILVPTGPGTGTGGVFSLTLVGSENYDGSGNPNPQNITGSDGPNVILTGSGNDLVNGGAGNDTITTNAGDDVVFGGEGDDTIIGGVGAGNDTYDGGDGGEEVGDTLVYSSATRDIFVDLAGGGAAGLDIDVDTISRFENVIGGGGNDIILGDDQANRLDGGDGNDVLAGGKGNDFLIGGTGQDTAVFTGVFGDYDVIFGPPPGEAQAQVEEEGGLVTIIGNDGTDTLQDVELLQFGNLTVALSDLDPEISASPSEGPEDSPIPLDLAALIPLDLADDYEVVITGLPKGASFYLGEISGRGEWTVGGDELFGDPPLSLVPFDNFFGEIEGLEISITDDGEAVATSDPFTVTVTPVNDAPFLDTNSGAAVGPGTDTSFSSDQLRVSDVDTPADEVVFTLLEAPEHGTLLWNQTAHSIGGTNSFTQADVSAGLLRFEADGGGPAEDGFRFTANDGSLTIVDTEGDEGGFSVVGGESTFAIAIEDQAAGQAYVSAEGSEEGGGADLTA